MNRFTSSSALAIGTALTLAACGMGGTSSSGQPSTSSAATSPAKASPAKARAVSSSKALHVAHTSLGNVLVDARGMTVYLLTSDKPNTSRCSGPCLQYWPIVPGAQARTKAHGVMARLGTTKATNGSIMATAGGWPLYTFVKDKAAGDVTGEGVATFGGIWYAVSPSGQAVKGSAAKASSASPSTSSGGGAYGY
jgi:predicted lipoprotein with Yx(FWY)xxD motif